MSEREAHHALAAPNDVEAWSSGLDVFQPRHAHRYWRRIRRFYDWLQWHTEHPHVYTPVLMAAAEGGKLVRFGRCTFSEHENDESATNLLLRK